MKYCFVMITVASLFFSYGCGACQLERSIVSGFELGVSAADGAMRNEDVGDDWNVVLNAARAATKLGSIAVDMCEHARDGDSWEAFVGDALPAANTIKWFIDTLAGPEDLQVPQELIHAINVLEGEARRLELEIIDNN